MLGREGDVVAEGGELGEGTTLELGAAECPVFWPGRLGFSWGGPFENGAACRLPARRAASACSSAAFSAASNSAIRCLRAAFPATRSS